MKYILHENTIGKKYEIHCVANMFYFYLSQPVEISSSV